MIFGLILGVAITMNITQAELTKSQFLELIENNVNVVGGYTIYNVCNPTDSDINANMFDVVYDIKKGSLIDTNMEILTDVEKPKIEYQEVCVDKTKDKNGTQTTEKECSYSQITSVSKFKEWVKLDKASTKFDKGKCYQIKVSGRWKPAFKNQISIDNIVSYAGFTYPEFAWWNVSYDHYVNITLSNTSKIVTNHRLQLLRNQVLPQNDNWCGIAIINETGQIHKFAYELSDDDSELEDNENVTMFLSMNGLSSRTFSVYYANSTPVSCVNSSYWNTAWAWDYENSSVQDHDASSQPLYNTSQLASHRLGAYSGYCSDNYASGSGGCFAEIKDNAYETLNNRTLPISGMVDIQFHTYPFTPQSLEHGETQIAFEPVFGGSRLVDIGMTYQNSNGQLYVYWGAGGSRVNTASRYPLNSTWDKHYLRINLTNQTIQSWKIKNETGIFLLEKNIPFYNSPMVDGYATISTIKFGQGGYGGATTGDGEYYDNWVWQYETTISGSMTGEQSNEQPNQTTTTTTLSNFTDIIDCDCLANRCINNNTLEKSGYYNGNLINYSLSCPNGCDTTLNICMPSDFEIMIGLIVIIIIGGIIVMKFKSVVSYG